MNRRNILKGCTELLLSGKHAFGSQVLIEEEDSREILVVVFLRGGMDGLNLLAPVDDPNYRAARGGEMAVNEKGAQQGLMINQNIAQLDFRLHPNTGGLKELFDSKELAFIHACGLTNGTRSHFEAQDLMELGSNSDKNLKEGWLTRYMGTFHYGAMVPSFALGNVTPASLLGTMDQLNLTEIKDLKMDWNPSMQKLMDQMYSGGNSKVHQSGKSAIQNINHIMGAIKDISELEHYIPDEKAKYSTDYPGEEMAKSFKTAAQLIKMDVGLKIATVNIDGWDMHDAQSWRFPKLIESFSKNLLAFYNDLHNHHKKLTIVVQSEFGRRLKANKNGGTDHGHGGVMMVLGGNVNGGNIYGMWPGLANEQLDKGVDLAITTDYRIVLTEILLSRKLTKEYVKIFPDFKGYKPMGIMNSI
jgi:uncharacterized protein (DUF1501 family)